MPDPTRPPAHPMLSFLDQTAQQSADSFTNRQIVELGKKIDFLIAMLSPPKSAIITGLEVERVIKEIEKARGQG